MIPRPSDVDRLRDVWRAGVSTDYRIAGNTNPVIRGAWSVVNAVEPRLYVNGMIGGYDLDAAEFVKAVHALDAPHMHLHVNSPGGFYWDALSMYEALRSHPATVATHIDSLAGSAASFLALAGDTIDITAAGRVMIHDAAVAAAGSPADLREAADIADLISDDIAALYEARAGGSAAGWRKAMTATTWYSAEQAVSVGLAHRVAGTDTAGPDNRTRLILARQRALTTQGG